MAEGSVLSSVEGVSRSRRRSTAPDTLVGVEEARRDDDGGDASFFEQGSHNSGGRLQALQSMELIVAKLTEDKRELARQLQREREAAQAAAAAAAQQLQREREAGQAAEAAAAEQLRANWEAGHAAATAVTRRVQAEWEAGQAAALTAAEKIQLEMAGGQAAVAEQLRAEREAGRVAAEAAAAQLQDEKLAGQAAAAAAQRHVEKLEGQLATLQATVEEQVSALQADLAGRTAQLERERAQAASERQGWQQREVELQQDLAVSTARVDELRSHLQLLSSSGGHAAAAQRSDEHQAHLAGLVSSLNQLRQTTEAQAAECRQLSLQNKVLAEEVLSLRTTLQEREETVVKLQDENAALQAGHAQQSRALEATRLDLTVARHHWREAAIHMGHHRGVLPGPWDAQASPSKPPIQPPPGFTQASPLKPPPADPPGFGTQASSSSSSEVWASVDASPLKPAQVSTTQASPAKLWGAPASAIPLQQQQQQQLMPQHVSHSSLPPEPPGATGTWKDGRAGAKAVATESGGEVRHDNLTSVLDQAQRLSDHLSRLAVPHPSQPALVGLSAAAALPQVPLALQPSQLQPPVPPPQPQLPSHRVMWSAPSLGASPSRSLLAGVPPMSPLSPPMEAVGRAHLALETLRSSMAELAGQAIHSHSEAVQLQGGYSSSVTTRADGALYGSGTAATGQAQYGGTTAADQGLYRSGTMAGTISSPVITTTHATSAWAGQEPRSWTTTSLTVPIPPAHRTYASTDVPPAVLWGAGSNFGAAGTTSNPAEYARQAERTAAGGPGVKDEVKRRSTATAGDVGPTGGTRWRDDAGGTTDRAGRTQRHSGGAKVERGRREGGGTGWDVHDRTNDRSPRPAHPKEGSRLADVAAARERLASAHRTLMRLAAAPSPTKAAIHSAQPSKRR